jgi:hypothetical protein
MTSIKKIALVALTSLTVATTFAPGAEARPWRRHHGHGGAIAAGLVGAAILGTAIAASRPAYAAEVVEDECYRKHVGYNAYGRPVFRTVCY